MARFKFSLARRRDAASGLEYALIVGLVAVVALFAVTSVGSNTSNILATPFPTASPQEPVPDGVPDPVALDPLLDALPAEPVSSASFTITGIEVPVTFVMTGAASGTATVNGGSPQTTGTVEEGDTVTLNQTTPSGSLESSTVNFTVNGFTVASWLATTQEISDDVVATCTEVGTGIEHPRSAVPPNILCESNIVRITADPVSTPLLLRVFRSNGSSGFWNAPAGQYRVNTGSGFTSWSSTTSPNISVGHGDLVQLRAHTNPYRERSVNVYARVYFDNSGSTGGQLSQLNFVLTTDETGQLQPDGAVCPPSSPNCGSFGAPVTTEPGFHPFSSGEHHFGSYTMTARANVPGFQIRAYASNYNGPDPNGPIDPTLSINGGSALPGGTNNWHDYNDGDTIVFSGHSSDYEDDQFQYRVQVRYGPSSVNFNSSSVRIITNENGLVSGLVTGTASPTGLSEQDLLPGDGGAPHNRSDITFVETTEAMTFSVTPSSGQLCLLMTNVLYRPDVAQSLDTELNPQILRSRNGGGFVNLGTFAPGNTAPGDCITIEDGDQLKFIGHTSDYSSTTTQLSLRLRTFDSNTTLRNLTVNFRTADTGGLTLPDAGFEDD